MLDELSPGGSLGFYLGSGWFVGFFQVLSGFGSDVGVFGGDVVCFGYVTA